VMLLLSLLLGLLSLVGIAWIVIVGSLLSVDGLFMSLILPHRRRRFFSECLLECRDHGLIGKNKGSSSKNRRRWRRPTKIQTRSTETHGEPPTNVANNESRRRSSRISGAFRAFSPSHVHAQSIASLSHRLVDRAHAFLFCGALGSAAGSRTLRSRIFKPTTSARAISSTRSCSSVSAWPATTLAQRAGTPPQLPRLAKHPVEEVRNTDAWVMGQDTSAAAFHETLLEMLHDSSPMVRGNAALSLVRFGDAAGRLRLSLSCSPYRRRSRRRARDRHR